MISGKILVAGLVLMALGGARPQEARADDEARAREMEKIAAAVGPKAGKKDPALEKAIAAAYKEGYPDDKVKVLKVIIVSTGWSTERASTGIITGRTIQAVVVNQQKGNELAQTWGEPSGSYCELHSEAWQQEHNGKKFAGKINAYGSGSLSKSGILCAKVGVKETAAAVAAPPPPQKQATKAAALPTRPRK